MPVVTLTRRVETRKGISTCRSSRSRSPAPVCRATSCAMSMQVTYKDNIKEIDSFELTVNNWDAVAQRFQIRRRGNGRLTGRSNPLHRLFDPCRTRSRCCMGYGEQSATDADRERSRRWSPTFPSSGAPTLDRPRPERAASAAAQAVHLRTWEREKTARSRRTSRRCPTPSDRKQEALPAADRDRPELDREGG